MGQSHGPQPWPGASFCKARVDGGQGYQADIHSSPCVVPEKPRLQCSWAGEGPGGGPRVSSMLEHPLPPHLFLRAPGGGAQPKLPHPGAACVGFVGEMLTGGTRARPLVQSLRCHQSLACSGPGRRPVPPHPALPRPCTHQPRNQTQQSLWLQEKWWPPQSCNMCGLARGWSRKSGPRRAGRWSSEGEGGLGAQHGPQPPRPREGQLDDAFGKPSTAGLEASATSIVGGNKTH